MLDLLEQPTTFYPPLIDPNYMPESESVHVIPLYPLHHNKYALVSGVDLERVAPHKWNVAFYKELGNGGGFYALRYVYDILPDGTRKRRLELMSRFILELVPGDGLIADHEEPEETLNNCRTNLRIVTPAQSAFNRRKPCINTTGYKGVSRVPSGRYRAAIKYQGKTYWLGTYDTAEKAYAVYCAKALTLHGRFARLN